MASYRIFADATIDLPDVMLDAGDVTIIPMTVDISGESYTICGRESTIGNEDFYAMLAKGEIARTAQVTPNTYYQYFEEVFQQGQDALLISFSSGLSKSYEASLVCAEKIREDYPGRKLYCIDSICASGGHAILVDAAIRRQKEGYTIEELAKWVEENKYKVDTLLTVDELDTLLRGGRVSRTSATVGTMLNIKPVIHINWEGKLIPVKKIRGRKKAIEYFASEFKIHWNGSDDMVIVGYGTDQGEALILRDMIMADGGTETVELVTIGPVIGAHTGGTVIALYYFNKEVRVNSN